MSVYQYNGISVLYCKTVQFTMDMEYDPTNTDAIRNRYTVRVRGFVYPGQSGLFASTPTSSVLATIKSILQVPRKPFTYTLDANTILSIPSGIDAKKGPVPQETTVTEINSGIFAVETGVEVFTAGCPPFCDPLNPVLSLRWGQTETFDVNWYSRLRTKGKLIVRSDLRQNADNYRALMTPALLPDYQRQSAVYAMSPDGLEVDFEFDDQEVDRLAPYPATKAAGSYTVDVQRPGYLRTGTVNVSLEGPKGTSRDALMMRAYNMCYSILVADRTRAGAPAVWWGRFTQDLFVPKVSASMTALMQPLQTGEAAYNSLMPSLRDTVVIPGLASNQPGISVPERKRIFGLLAAMFRDPCACVSGGVSMTSSGSPSFPPQNSDMVGNPKYPVPPAEAVLTSSPVTYGPSTVIDPVPYDVYIVETTTSFANGVVMLPGTGVGPKANIAKPVSTSGQSMMVRINWVAGRTGTPPVMPSFYTNDTNLVPLSGDIVAKDTVPAPDGTTLTYMFSGYYEYGVIDPSKWQIRPPVPPYLSDLVRAAASAAASAWSDLIVVGVPQQAQTEPLVPNGVSLNSQPTPAPGFQGVVTPPGAPFPIPGLGGIFSNGGGFVDLSPGGGGPVQQ